MACADGDGFGVDTLVSWGLGSGFLNGLMQLAGDVCCVDDVYGEVEEASDSEMTLGEYFSADEILVILLPATDRAMEDAYEFWRTLDEVDDTEPCFG